MLNEIFAREILEMSIALGILQEVNNPRLMSLACIRESTL